MIFFKKSSPFVSKRSRCSREMRILSTFISLDNTRSTHLAQNFQNPRTPIMCPIPNATAISFCLMRRFPRISSSTRAWWSWSLAVTGLPLRVLSLKYHCPISPSLNRLTQLLTVLTSTHWSPLNGLHSSVNFNWRNFFHAYEFNNSTHFEPKFWKLFHFNVHWVRTVSICVFKVK